ncbi:MAG: DUF6285 domain-containing protein [Burkholderiaceae bacterium]
MQDTPTPVQLLTAVAVFLREQAMPQLSGHTAFHARVAANAIDIVIRQLQAQPVDEPLELARLHALLGSGKIPRQPDEDELRALNRELCGRIADGRLTLDTPGLADHLWATTLSKLAVDQPKYESYRRIAAGQDRSTRPAHPPRQSDSETNDGLQP